MNAAQKLTSSLARIAPTKEVKIMADPLVGKFFHTFEKDDDGAALVFYNRGQVRSRVKEGLYLVVFLHDDGDGHKQVLRSTEAMANWMFFDDPTAWRVYQGGLPDNGGK